MIVRSLLQAVRRIGVDRYTVLAWEARLFSRHYQAVLELLVIALVLLAMWVFL